MAVVFQGLLPSGTLDDVYTVTGAWAWQELAVYLCNTHPTLGATVSIAIALQGAEDASRQYLYRGRLFRPLETAYMELTIAQGDVLRMLASTGAVACTIMSMKTEKAPKTC